MAEINRVIWEKGDFGAVAPLIWPVGQHVVERVDVKAGERVLDVACGTGNAALRAAARGAEVVGLDIVPALLEQGRALAREQGVEVEWVEGDAEAMPFGDESFDVVLSTFGCMFAPDHRAMAREIARVLRPGGRIGLCSWSPEGSTGQFFATIGSHLPPPPEGSEPPPLWGTEEHVREVFAGTGIEPEFDRGMVAVNFESADEALELFSTKFGPVIAAKEALDPEGKWEALADDLRSFFDAEQERRGEAGYDGAYLIALGAKSA